LTSANGNRSWNGLPFSFYLEFEICYLKFESIMGEYSMGDAIRKFLEQSQIRNGIQALQIEEVWEQIMGKTIARYTDKLKIVNDTLFITTQVAPLRQELIFQKDKIVLRVNEALGQKVISKIVVQ
jgi:hypothetical protein